MGNRQVVVAYDTNGGSPLPTQAVEIGGTVTFQNIPVKECYSFAGWFYDSALTQAYKASDLINKNLTLYAKWSAQSAPCGGAASPPSPPSRNLALNSLATADSACMASQSAANAVDGSVTNDSKWCSMSGSHWLQIDLGAVKQVSQFVIRHASEGGQPASLNTKAYNIQVSADAKSWSTVVNVTNNTSGVTIDNIPDTLARYMRLNVTTATQTADTTARIYEFGVYEHQNLALNKAAKADSTCNVSETAANAVDGSEINNSKWCSNTANRWLQIDLGSAKQVSQFIIKHASEGGEAAYFNTKAYNIQVSVDGTNWSTAVRVTNNTSGETVDNITPVSARYIKLNVTMPTQTADVYARIYEIEVFGPPNLALHSLAAADSTCNASQTAAKAVDGSVINDSKWCSKSSNRWLQLDLGSVKQVSQFVIKHASEGGETASYNTKAYNIQVSTDGKNWTKAVDVTNNSSGITVNKINAMPARYIKLNVTMPTQTTNAAARIYEFEAYGPPNIALNTTATADSTCNAAQTAAKAVDGSVINDSKWCSLSGNRWLQLDLGSVKQVNQFVIKHASEGGETASYNTKAYNIQVSADGTKWTTAVNATTNTGGITVNKITEVSARYIKLNVTVPTQTANAAARIYEFEVYGPDYTS
ncbi:hypothetical protein GZH47_16575 [Paenibacillus rhizovicinus]|uniref:F5/8 type C domain-containing protein n=1 Tax=Paenibacillus rhizovicinus TaxID=2704463 RepID=A0A6C0P1C4_9BACL|nr:discoidin domain-containing protein [Paenibacillus rhizovicinus]QHW32259.1 hypothetical protein GZH47_16575 [Paenibacillus rhizovicinus]